MANSSPVFAEIIAHSPVILRGPGFWQSSYDRSWWKSYSSGKRNKFYGAEHNLPEYVKTALMMRQKRILKQRERDEKMAAIKK